MDARKQSRTTPNLSEPAPPGNCAGCCKDHHCIAALRDPFMAKTTRPCPFCGEEIKVDAAKCRFCGEYLEDDDDENDDEDEDDGGGAMKWVAPVGRSGFAILAGYLGILALVPIPFILYGFFSDEKVAKQQTTSVV